MYDPRQLLIITKISYFLLTNSNSPLWKTPEDANFYEIIYDRMKNNLGGLKCKITLYSNV